MSISIGNAIDPVLEADRKADLDMLSIGDQPKLTKAQEADTKLYAGTSCIDSFGRSIKYLSQCIYEDPSEISLRILSISIPTILCVTAVGTVVGALAGGVVGTVKGGAMSVPGALTGAKIGGCAGFTLGIAVSSIHVTIQIRQSDHYIRWKTQALQDKVYPLFQDFLKQDEQFQDLICPISFALPVVPVKSPNGHVYEKASIEKWLLSNPDNPCPLRGKSFTKSDLVYDQKHLNKIIKRAKELLNQKLNPHVGEGLRALNESLTSNRFAVFQGEHAMVAKEAFDKGLTPDQFASLSKDVYKRNVEAE